MQQRFFLGDVQTGSDAARMPRIHQIQSFLQRFHGAAQDSDFGIQLAQVEIIAGELRGHQQADIFHVGCVRLIGGFRRFDASPAPAKEVHLVVDGERQYKGVLLYRLQRYRHAIRRAISGQPLASDVGPEAARPAVERGEKRGDLNRSGRSRLFQVRDGNLDGLIFGERLFLEGVQFVVIENGPPLALWHAVFRCAFAPRLRDIPLRRRRRGGSFVIRSDGAAAEQRPGEKQRRRHGDARDLHRPRPEASAKLGPAPHYFLVPPLGDGLPFALDPPATAPLLCAGWPTPTSGAGRGISFTWT